MAIRSKKELYDIIRNITNVKPDGTLDDSTGQLTILRGLLGLSDDFWMDLARAVSPTEIHNMIQLNAFGFGHGDNNALYNLPWIDTDTNEKVNPCMNIASSYFVGQYEVALNKLNNNGNE